MDRKHFEPNKRSSFTLESGKLIIADPFLLGYPEEIEDKICAKIRDQKDGEYGSVTYLSRGVIYYYPEDSSWNVYRTERGLSIVNDNEGEDRVMKKICEKNLPEKTKKKELREKGFLFETDSNACVLFIGDQRVFGLDESEFQFQRELRNLDELAKHDKWSERFYNDQRRSLLRHHREYALERHQHLAEIKPGKYSCRIRQNGIGINLL
ncbi:hypothetical protein HY450_02845 [Candidatus Pacearchaeota archaeon]|nr:hypothetical protein [Candidatus Pacearchaeota archaeon]